MRAGARVDGPLKAIVLDWAGTTIDYGSRAPALSFVGAFAALDVTLTVEEARRPMGQAKRDHIRALFELPQVAAQWRRVHGTPPDEGAVNLVYATFLPIQRHALLAHGDLIPGTVEAVAACRARGMRVGSSTGYTRELMDVLAPVAAAQGYEPDAVLTATDIAPGRPAPFLIFENARRLGVWCMDSIVKVDDSVTGIAAGRNAGCWTVGVTRSGNLLGLARAEAEALPAAVLRERLEPAERAMCDAGAHVVIEDVGQLPEALDEIERRRAASSDQLLMVG